MVWNSICVLIALMCSAAGSDVIPPRNKWPQVVSHRGACGYVPEHSLNSYQLAIDLGTDYVEPDLCLTKDGIFVAMHDITLDATTDIADHPEFADRYKGDGYYIADFMLDELKTLRLKQRSNSRTALYNNLLAIPTLTEIIALVRDHYDSSGGFTIGLYPELKDPHYHNGLGFDLTMEEMLINQLASSGYQVKDLANNFSQVQPVVIQCFEAEPLVHVRELSDLPVMQLIGVGAEWTEQMVSEFGKYAQVLGPDKALLTDMSLEDARAKISLARQYGMAVHPWTFKQDGGISTQFNNDPQIEAAYFYCCLGVDAAFVEYPDYIREIVDDLTFDHDALCAMAGC